VENRCRLHPWEELLEQRYDGREVKMGRSDRSNRKSLLNGERERIERERMKRREIQTWRDRERDRKRGKGREWRKLRRDAEVVQLQREGSGDEHLSREKIFDLVLTDTRTTFD